MKRILYFIATIIAVFSLSVSASAAETIDDLNRIYKNLSNYIYRPYFEKSQYYEGYVAQMEFVAALLKDDAITQEEIDTGYNALKESYANMMKDTYDYSNLPVLVHHFDKLDASIFTDDSWKKLVSIVDEIKTEIDSPAIYFRDESYTEESYRAKTQSYIDNFETLYAQAFNQLKFNELFFNDELTKVELSSYHDYILSCINKEYMEGCEEYTLLMSAIDNAENTFLRQNPSQERLQSAKTTLDEAFIKLQQKFMDFSAIDSEISTFEALSSIDYESKSYQRYEKEIATLKKAKNVCHYFYIPTKCDSETFTTYSQNFINSVLSPVKNASSHLLSITLVEELKTLCDQYRSVTTIEGLELKLGLLNNALKNGEALLLSDEATETKYEEAIKAVKECYHDLKNAEAFLIEEQSRVIKQDEKTVRIILIFAISSLSLSIGLACVITKQRYGAIDWTR